MKKEKTVVPASGECMLKQVKDKLKKAFDKCDVNGDGVLDREEMRAGCLAMAKSIAQMSGQPVDRIVPNIERELDHVCHYMSLGPRKYGLRPVTRLTGGRGWTVSAPGHLRTASSRVVHSSFRLVINAHEREHGRLSHCHA